MASTSSDVSETTGIISQPSTSTSVNGIMSIHTKHTQRSSPT